MSLEIKNQKRNIAYKFWIGDLLKATLSLNENRLNYAELGNRKIVRVNLVASIIEKYQHNEKPYASFTLDDSSGQIRVKTFDNDKDNLTSFNIGDSVRVIGTLRHFNGELYMQPEIIKKVDERWLLVRKLELGEPMQEIQPNSLPVVDSGATTEASSSLPQEIAPKQEIEEIKIETTEPTEKVVAKQGEQSVEPKAEPVEEGIKGALFSKISENSDGIDIDNLIMSLNYPVAEINSNITELIEEGKIYEPHPGKLRSI